MHENLEILRNVQLTQTFTHKNALKSLETLDLKNIIHLKNRKSCNKSWLILYNFLDVKTTIFFSNALNMILIGTYRWKYYNTYAKVKNYINIKDIVTVRCELIVGAHVINFPQIAELNREYLVINNASYLWNGVNMNKTRRSNKKSKKCIVWDAFNTRKCGVNMNVWIYLDFCSYYVSYFIIEKKISFVYLFPY